MKKLYLIVPVILILTIFVKKILNHYGTMVLIPGGTFSWAAIMNMLMKMNHLSRKLK